MTPELKLAIEALANAYRAGEITRIAFIRAMEKLGISVEYSRWALRAMDDVA